MARRGAPVPLSCLAAGLALTACSAAATTGPVAPVPPSRSPLPVLPPHRVVTASLSTPALATQGDTVTALLPTGQATVTVVGPMPAAATKLEADQVDVTFFVRAVATRGTVPIGATGFLARDDQHAVHELIGHGEPATLRAGQSSSFTLTARVPSGNGGLEWSPTGGATVVDWDYALEVD